MPSETAFHVLVARVRAGDEAAAADLVHQYEPQLRRLIRLRLTDPRLTRVLDSVDVCQSVLANFFVRAAAGQFELNTPDQLIRLLATMARNKLLNQVERHQAGRRDARRQHADGANALATVAGTEATPSRIVAGKELLEQVHRLLSEEDRFLADQRSQGRGWAEIAAELGASPEALRKKLARATDRVARQLGLEGVADE
jgi:RNA polymerase sigma factor (sigma-70 family)